MLKSADLIAAFENRIVLPIELNEVAAWLIERRYQDHINFIPVDLDTGVIRGFLRRTRVPQGGWDINPLEVSDIYYDREQGSNWIHLVCAKELIHVLDAARCATREEYKKLRESLSLPNDVQNLLAGPDYTIIDKLGSLPAAALLLPWAARELMMPAYKAKVLNDETIAEMAALPTELVRSVMSPVWPMIYAMLMGRPAPETEGDPTLFPTQ